MIILLVLYGVWIEKMKRAMLSLNPDAASYTPLDKRITDVKAKIADVSSSHSKGLCRTEQCQFQGEASSGSDNHANEELHMANALTGMDSLNLSDQTKKQIVNDSHEMDSHNLSDQTKKKQIVEDSREMDLSYLTFLFPNISEQCLADVYFLNATDVESSIDMLNELEVKGLMCHVALTL